jgi:hypothetical protein
VHFSVPDYYTLVRPERARFSLHAQWVHSAAADLLRSVLWGGCMPGNLATEINPGLMTGQPDNEDSTSPGIFEATPL